MNILLLGSNYFKNPLEAMGYRTLWVGSDPDCDVTLPPNRLDIPYILSRQSFKPNVIVLTDDLGRRVFPSGLEKTDIFKVWYGVDTPLNFFWQKEYAALFDLVLVDQLDKAKALTRYTQAPVQWLPVGVDTRIYQGPDSEKAYDFAFVGSLNEKVRPKRTRIVDILKQRFQVKTAGGRQSGWVSPREAGALYRQSKLVLNENLFDGVTTRMLEGMASGTALFTEAAQNGLGHLFLPGEDLIAFDPDNIIELADFYLKNDRERKKVADAGKDKVLAAHDIRHRTETLVETISKTCPGRGVREDGEFYRQMGKVLFLAGIRWPHHNGQAKLLRAETLLLRADRMGRTDPDSLYYLGILKKLKGDPLAGLSFLEISSSAGNVRASLALGFQALENGQNFLAKAHFNRAIGNGDFTEAETLQKFPSGKTLTAEHHFALGLLLEAAGHDLTPGFSRAGIDISLWNALEHYLMAANLDVAHVKVLTRLGSLLAKHGAYTQAYKFLARASALAPDASQLAEKAAQAARHGYIFPEEGPINQPATLP